VLESYCHYDVTLLRKEGQLFRRKLMRIANIDVFLEFITMASVCNKVFGKIFLQPDCIGLTPKVIAAMATTVRNLYAV
jgi:hypothetical protein